MPKEIIFNTNYLFLMGSPKSSSYVNNEFETWPIESVLDMRLINIQLPLLNDTSLSVDSSSDSYYMIKLKLLSDCEPKG